MGLYANTVNAYAQDLVNARLQKRAPRYNDYGQTSLMLNVSIMRFRNDVMKKAQKLIATATEKRIAELQQEIVRLQTQQITL